MRYFLSDCKRLYRSKMALITWAVLAVLTVIGPLYHRWTLSPMTWSGMDHPYFWWLVMNNGIAANIFYAVLLAWPVLCTGLVFARERLSSAETLSSIRGGRRRYLLSKECSSFLVTFLNMAVLLLLNVWITNLLYQADIPFTSFEQGRYYIPKEGSIGWFFCQSGPLAAEIAYSVLMALYMALLAALTVGIQMALPLRNLYLAFLVPLIALHAVDFALQALLPAQYVPSVFLQPKASTALASAPSPGNVVIGFLALSAVCLIVFLLGLFRSRDTL
ncbi:MAG: hypothetical protein NC541_15040 [bacterium]|nr:hypothetical protein [bacterium]